MLHDIAFLHTAESHVKTFEELLGQVSPGLSARHIIDESLLQEAQAAGTIDQQLTARIRSAMFGAASTGARVVVCTCSTIGGVAEQAGEGQPFTSMRIDRAMADEAVRLGPRILIVATLQSTLSPTCELIEDSAKRLKMPVKVSELLVENTWANFERGQREEYWQAIAGALTRYPDEVDVIVLAQASMAGAIDRCGALSVPVLSSPRLGLEAAVRAFGGM